MSEDEITVGAMSIRLLAEGSEAKDSMAMFEVLAPAGAGTPAPICHDAFEETIYGLAGTTTFFLDGVTKELREGEELLIPRGVVHTFANYSEDDAQMLCTVTPGGLDESFFTA